jgi:sarcosine oxidase subunit alpha
MSKRLPLRLSQGGLIDRSKPLNFTFNGRRMTGFSGDTLASALIANDIRVIGRSFKYHRPRGFLGVGVEDPNSMLAVKDAYGYDPAIRAGQVQLVEGLDVRTVTGWPSAQFDVGAALQLISPILIAGFYYKTMMWPNWSWFEGAVKKTTGFGQPSDVEDTRHYEHNYENCDVLIIGGGAAGLSAAKALIGSNLRVVIVDDQPKLGASLLWEEGTIDGQSALIWASETIEALAAEGTLILSSTIASGAYEENIFTLLQSEHDDLGVKGERLWKLHAKNVVMATGAIDRPIIFQNNDRPGVMLSSAVRRYINEFGLAPGKRIAVHTTNDSGYLTAIAAQRAGLIVPVLIDSRPKEDAVHAELAVGLGIPCIFKGEISDTKGYKSLRRISVTSAEGLTHYDCDILAISGGWTPIIHLAAHRGFKPQYDAEKSMFLCPEAPEGWKIVGGASGALSLNETLLSGHAAGENILATGRQAPVGICEIDYGHVSPLWQSKTGKESNKWVDLQNDVKVSDIALASRENYTSVEHLKRYTTLGMGTDQGRTSNVNGLAILASMTGVEISDVGTTTFRPPYCATRMSAIADKRQGDLYRPRRRMPAHDFHVTEGAEFEDFGWERPDWYRHNSTDRESAVTVEMQSVRELVGIFDASPLGKIEIAGPDAREFLNNFYVSNLMTLKHGRIRYSVMLKDDGVIFDDGVVTCIDDFLFIVSPTSGNAEAVADWFQRWHQTEWPHMEVAIAPVTSNWASIAIAGPKARDLLQALEPSFDISHDALPHMGFCEGFIAGVTVRVARVSFTGELQYELSVPSRYAASLLNNALKLGIGMGARLVGMESWLRLRLEKGYIHLGADTNGRTTPLDIGMANIVAEKEADFIGKRSLTLPFALSDECEKLVGLRSENTPLPIGGRVLVDKEKPPCTSVGYVTSACTSPSAGNIGMALIKNGDQRLGETVRIYDNGQVISATICTPTFIDEKNERLYK